MNIYLKILKSMSHVIKMEEEKIPRKALKKAFWWKKNGWRTTGSKGGEGQGGMEGRQGLKDDGDI